MRTRHQQPVEFRGTTLRPKQTVSNNKLIYNKRGRPYPNVHTGRRTVRHKKYGLDKKACDLITQSVTPIGTSPQN